MHPARRGISVHLYSASDLFYVYEKNLKNANKGLQNVELGDIVIMEGNFQVDTSLEKYYGRYYSDE